MRQKLGWLRDILLGRSSRSLCFNCSPVAGISGLNGKSMKLNELSFAFLEKIISYFIDIPNRAIVAELSNE